MTLWTSNVVSAPEPQFAVTCKTGSISQLLLRRINCQPNKGPLVIHNMLMVPSLVKEVLTCSCEPAPKVLQTSASLPLPLPPILQTIRKPEAFPW